MNVLSQTLLQALLVRGAPHVTRQTSIAALACRCVSTERAASSVDSEDAKRKALASKLTYRSKQRGFLELDLLVGLWAEKEIPKLSMEQLQALSQVLDQENPDLFKWLTGQLPPPEEMQKNPAFVSLRKSAEEQLASRSSILSRAAPGKDWVRGWDDGWRKGTTETTKQ